ncbi:hypothetical protein [Sphingobacterium sp. MYb388]|uniref:hypothetical protein n=1 Tax=Sphingobacterium sp. MYb388 TaxID=2745437 RepID=UPI0030B4B686
MHTIEIESKNKRIELPSCWDECQSADIFFILENAFKVVDGSMSIALFRIKMFQHFTGLKFGLSYQIRHFLKLNKKVNTVIYQLSQQLCDWIFEAQDDHYKLTFDSTINYFPELANTAGPADLLSDLTFGEFQESLNLMNAYFDNYVDTILADECLIEFIALIYRPLVKGKRVPLTDYTADDILFKKIPRWKLRSIMIWFTNCINAIKSEDLTINGLDVNFSGIFPEGDQNGNKKRKGLDLGWTGVLIDIAESGVFGPAPRVNETPLYDILFFLMKRQDEYQRQLEASQKK